MDKIRILVADDHPTFREGLGHLLDNESDLECIAKVSEGKEAVRLAKELRPDVAILDVAMPGLNGIEAAKQIKQECPTTAILMISAFDYESYIIASLRAGAAGYILKNAVPREIVSAVRSVRAGDAVFDLNAARNILRRVIAEKGKEKRCLEELHSRELEVLRLAARGISNKEISQELVISERTVQTHMVHIFRKLQVGSRTEAVLRAFKEGWLTPDDLP